ncbi:MAG: AMP-binding protein, partial [Clostridia bacterium]|nr:AMP-binding protein [Clostridia bacterium]
MTNPPLYDVRRIQDLKDMLEQSCKLFGDRNAFLLKVQDDQYKGVTYRQFKAEVDALGTIFLKLGLKDQFIAVISENRYEWCLTYFSTVNGTGTIVPLDKELPLPEIENLLARSSASAVVFSGKFHNELKKLHASLPSLQYLINMDIEEETDGVLSFKQLLQEGKKLLDSGDTSFIDAPIDAEAMRILLFTSGTTELAKGVMLSHKNLCSDIMDVCRVLYLDCNDSSLSILPLHHTYGCTTDLLVILYNGCSVSFNEGLKHIAKNLKETKPTLLFLVPLILESMYKKIWDQAKKKPGQKTKLKIAMAVSDFLLNVLKIDIRRKLFKQIHENIGGRVRLIVSGAAGINPEVSKGFHSMGLRVIQGYGLT